MLGALIPPCDFGSIAVSIDGWSFDLPQMKSHASFWILIIIGWLGAAMVQMYQALDSTSELNSIALPAKVRDRAFRDAASYSSICISLPTCRQCFLYLAG